MVAAQALSLLSWDATATFLLNPAKPVLVDHKGALRPEAVGLFVEGMLVGAFEETFTLLYADPGSLCSEHAHPVGQHLSRQQDAAKPWSSIC